ncbi:DUF308 domain-containing protein [Pseudonocardia humida]|uniref:DUF308 domain-containing protein n=1 Tax=Pseudonocardia humida TaxID=2800819 RepID=A0ABT0ZYP2_9PSEU|nr:DUF308 domain-containing protein [Pseudonocardia humida]MCO1655860.1 DUF308 domain-containing protein [Pseudonocardia humida]
MNSGSDERPQPSGGGRAPDEFDAIVAAWRREGPVPVWPDDDLFAESAPAADKETGPDLDTPTAPTPAAATGPVPPPSGPRDHSPPTRPEDEHYIPPEPPPLPRLGPPAIVGLVLLGLGLLLVLVPGWLGVGPAYGLPLGLLTLAAGLGWLVLRLWPDPPTPPRDGDDDGAVI